MEFDALLATRAWLDAPTQLEPPPDIQVTLRGKSAGVGRNVTFVTMNIGTWGWSLPFATIDYWLKPFWRWRSMSVSQKQQKRLWCNRRVFAEASAVFEA